MNRSYRTTDIKRSGNLVNFGGDLENIWSNIEEQWSIFAWERKQRNKDRKAKRAARKEQEKSQEQEIEDIKWAQAAASKGGEIAIDKTTAQPDVTNNSPKYKQWEISILAAALNSATDVNLLQRVETQRYTVTTDSTIIAYKIPILTRQIYRTVQEAVKQSANAIISVCKEHCANVPWYCGEEIK